MCFMRSKPSYTLMSLSIGVSITPSRWLAHADSVPTVLALSGNPADLAAMFICVRSACHLANV